MSQIAAKKKVMKKTVKSGATLGINSAFKSFETLCEPLDEKYLNVLFKKKDYISRSITDHVRFIIKDTLFKAYDDRHPDEKRMPLE